MELDEFQLEHAFARRQVEAVNIAPERHFETAGESFEDAFDFVMLVGAFGFDVEVDMRSVGKAFEEMEKHFGRDVADAFAAERSVPYEPRTPAEVDGDGAETVIHRQTVAITFDAPLVGERLSDTAAERKRSILDGVVLVYVKVAFCAHEEVDAAVFAYLFEHVVEEAEPCVDVADALPV